MTMRTVSLELLRHGPSHNQLLSPLTPYLALCGNYNAETVHVGFEHLQLARYVEQLRYAHGMRMASFALQDAAREVSRVLESIHSLTAELATSDPVEGRRKVHLRLVLSASELALLPFELATSHTGMPGQGQPLSLQTVTPVCLTREVRRVAATEFKWPHRPRILFVSAAPQAVSMVPAREHLAKLEEALSPYLDMEKEGELDRHLTVLSEATLEDVREACSRNAYTHVHILAHGIQQEATSDVLRYGLAFHAKDNRNDVDIVTGERLASALRCHMRDKGGQELSSPVVVSIASCDSANMGNVVAPGASIAHALHEQGIPLVIGSQFPLSVPGSIVMTGVLYRRLLAGEDPRDIVHDLRQTLHTSVPNTHDWASLVVYAAFPHNLHEQLRRARFEQARRALSVMMARADKVAIKEFQHQGESAGTVPPSSFKEVKQQLQEAMARFEEIALREGVGTEQVKTWGVLASAWKQVAFFLSVQDLNTDKPEQFLLQNEPFRKALEKARHYYYECYRVGSAEAWPLVQYLALTVGLGWDKRTKTGKTSRRFKQLWAAAHARAEDNLHWGNLQQKAWAHGSMSELQLLALSWEAPTKLERCKTKALRHVELALDIRDMRQYEEADFDTRSLMRHLMNYTIWEWGTEEMRELSSALLYKLSVRGVRDSVPR
jgi:CHAT domain-containing protein